jgi:glycosyltransferase involved in cell wall biosynthesis
VNLFGPINHLGMGIHFTNWAARLIELIEITQQVFVHAKGPIGINRNLPSKAEKILLDRMEFDRFSSRRPSIQFWHPNGIADFAGSKRALYTVFETTEPLNGEGRSRGGYGELNAIFVPSRWATQVMGAQAHYVDAYAIPGGIDPEIFHRTNVGLPWMIDGPEDEIRFLSVGKLEKRKGIHVLADALVQVAPKAQRPIRLIAHWHNAFVRDWLKEVHELLLSRGFERKGPVASGLPIVQYTYKNVTVDVLISTVTAHAEMVELYRSAHWMAYPSFAEGWGMPLHEALATGVPAIAQKYSGPADYLPMGGYIPLEGTDVVAKDGVFFHGDKGTWRQVSTESLIEALKKATEMSREDWELGSTIAALAGTATWKVSADKTIDLLRNNFGWL